MISLEALSELIMVSDHIIIIGEDYTLSFDKEDVSCDSPPEGGLIEFGFKHHKKRLFMDNVVHIIWEVNSLTLTIFEERKTKNEDE